mmetsp:Transcript_24289/g.45954  ORF Transcript_24289/g.45954 Transcript_24289/m.45954 type:complete len:351 (-) Transcript_24289:38-1090(-)
MRCCASRAFFEATSFTSQPEPGISADSTGTPLVADAAPDRIKIQRWLDDVKSAGRLKRTVTFPVGEWFLGVGDGGIGRDKDNPAGGALILKGSMSDFDEDARPSKYETMSSDTQDQANLDALQGDGAARKVVLGNLGLNPSSEEFKETHEPPRGGWTNNARAGVASLPKAGYDGELQLLEDHRSEAIHFSDLTDSSRFSCQQAAWGPGPGGPGQASTLKGYPHPQIELDHPESFVHVHLEDKTAGPTPRVLWDAAYDMGGTEVLKSTAAAMWGQRPNMELICPPKNGPPHWLELTLSREANARRRPYMMQDFIASQVITAYRSDHDPQLDAFSLDVDKENSGEAAKVVKW